MKAFRIFLAALLIVSALSFADAAPVKVKAETVFVLQLPPPPPPPPGAPRITFRRHHHYVRHHRYVRHRSGIHLRLPPPPPAPPHP